jgi:protein-S-isoprenylcysteine O-methyltransferase Ste14
VLNVEVVQVLAAVDLVALVGGFVLGHALGLTPRGPVRIVARNHPPRWTEYLWVLGALVAAFWPLGVLLLPAYAYGWPIGASFPGSPGVQLAGFALSLGGGLLFFVSARALGRHMTPEIRVQEGHRLVQEGPYRYIRHPVYTAIVIGAAGSAIVFESLPLGVLAVTLFGLAEYRARLEEALLGSAQGFGPAYEEYVARTGRFVPRFRGGR